METFNFDPGGSLEKINVPCLVMGTTEDRLLDLAAIWRLHLKTPGSEFSLLRGGHQTMVEYPERTNEAIDHFLRKHQI